MFVSLAVIVFAWLVVVQTSMFFIITDLAIFILFTIAELLADGHLSDIFSSGSFRHMAATGSFHRYVAGSHVFRSVGASCRMIDSWWIDAFLLALGTAALGKMWHTSFRQKIPGGLVSS